MFSVVWCYLNSGGANSREKKCVFRGPNEIAVVDRQIVKWPDTFWRPLQKLHCDGILFWCWFCGCILGGSLVKKETLLCSLCTCPKVSGIGMVSPFFVRLHFGFAGSWSCFSVRLFDLSQLLCAFPWVKMHCVQQRISVFPKGLWNQNLCKNALFTFQ